MNFSSSTSLDLDQKMLLHTAIDVALHTDSLKYTVKREKGLKQSYIEVILYLPKEKKK
jgi:hypothetical protein